MDGNFEMPQIQSGSAQQNPQISDNQEYSQNPFGGFAASSFTND